MFGCSELFLDTGGAHHIVQNIEEKNLCERKVQPAFMLIPDRKKNLRYDVTRASESQAIFVCRHTNKKFCFAVKLPTALRERWFNFAVVVQFLYV